ncbi:MAG: hypothetical protein CR984_03240 [Proteobacteria bacterium]|nr:MAG: hypothetical protein CR984_03240 [Pseudomonadota bacterium]PIE67862.1 MAG: hypothetical protein CSA23_01925 [Deltaproteobacteria bacterium]
MPTPSFFLATDRSPIDDTHPLWNQPLPTSRSGHATAETVTDEANLVSYGDYFFAVVRFCSHAGWKRVLLAAADKMEPPPTVESIGDVSIFLEKHGAFYHPARIEMVVGGQRLSLVVNVAISRIGKRVLLQETKALEHLGEARPFGWFPTVYATEKEPVAMYLGDWFEGFHEFHLTRRNGGREPGLVIWDGAAVPHLLSEHHTMALYRNMAMILTACYDPFSTCQIFPWHHAAGDFVVRLEAEKTAVRLITVRNYAPLIESSAGIAGENEILEALLLFFLHLSVRMRLDRLDGVSEVVWALDTCLAPTIDGFFQGLDLTARMSGLPKIFPEIFNGYVRAKGDEALRAMAIHLVETVFDRRSEEHQVIKTHLESHLSSIIHLMSNRA